MIAACLISAIALSMLAIACSSWWSTGSLLKRSRCARASRKSDSACKYAGCLPGLSAHVGAAANRATVATAAIFSNGECIRRSPDFDCCRAESMISRRQRLEELLIELKTRLVRMEFQSMVLGVVAVL